MRQYTGLLSSEMVLARRGSEGLMRVLLLTPPMTQLNTPYPATAYLTGFLRQNGVDTVQADPAIELVLKLFSKNGLTEALSEILSSGRPIRGKLKSRVLDFFIKNSAAYIARVEPVMGFLQGKDPSLALRIVSREYLPEGPRFDALLEGTPNKNEENEENGGPGSDPIHWAFGSLGVQDRAKYLASLFIDDLADVIREGVDSKFELSRYGEKLAASCPSFDPLEQALKSKPTLVDRYLADLTSDLFNKHQPTVIALTVPFPGNVYGALRIAKEIRRISPDTQILLGGGYVNTELRDLKDPRIFDYVDLITLDDGEKPFLCILEWMMGKRPQEKLMRTFIRKNGAVIYINDVQIHDIPHSKTGTPTYDGLPMDKYLSIFEMLNPMQRLWSDGRWNKATLAHGCYWKKCNFCDVSLDYIGRYDPASADLVVDRMEALISETGQRGFHFVDEAAPPALLRGVAERLIERQVTVTWWGNVRFDKTFTPELTALLAKSGCVAVSGGLEVASDRLLKLMRKGVTVEQVARVTRAFTDAGIMVHAYLMYGFPTQTEQETVDALEQVRQLFSEGCIQSAYWHRFAATAHSPIGMNPEQFGIRLLPPNSDSLLFARNDIDFEDPTGCDHDRLGEGLRKALYNYMHGVGLDFDVRFWFGQKIVRKKPVYLVPESTVSENFIAASLQAY